MRLNALGDVLVRCTCAITVIIPLLMKSVATASEAQADSADVSGIVVLDVLPPLYQPARGGPGTTAEADACRAWSLDKLQAAAALRLSTELREGELNDFYWLPCWIKGRAQIQGKVWEFEINAAGTSIWRSGGETRLMGCSQAACEPLVILMPER
jgi:hypothetical protein